MGPGSSLQPHRALIILEPGLVSDHVVKEWLDSGQEVAAFWTGSRRAERPRFSQRVRAAASGAVPFGTLSKKLAVPVRLIDRLSRMPNLRQEIASTGADTLITLMTHQIVPSEVLEMFGRKAVNFHPALLPHYKGKAPRISMLVDGKAEEYGGITVHRLVREIDEGPLIGQRPLPWSKTPDYVIWDVAAALAAAEMVRCDLIPYLDGRFEARPQDPNEGNYRNCTKHEFDITPDKTLAAVMRLFECSPGFTHRWSPLSGAVRRDGIPGRRPDLRDRAPVGSSAASHSPANRDRHQRRPYPAGSTESFSQSDTVSLLETSPGREINPKSHVPGGLSITAYSGTSTRTSNESSGFL